MFAFARFRDGLSCIDVMIVMLAFAWVLASIWRAVRQRDYWGLVAPTVATILLSGIVIDFWDSYQDWRILILLGPLGAIGLAKLNKGWGSEKARIANTILIACVTVNYGCIPVLRRLPPFGMWDTDEIVAKAPGGAYSAVLVNTDGLTFGYDYLDLRPSKFELATLLDRPRRQVIEFECEGDVIALHWDSASHLSVLVRPGTKTVWRRASWHGVRIDVVPDTKAEPMQG